MPLAAKMMATPQICCSVKTDCQTSRSKINWMTGLKKLMTARRPGSSYWMAIARVVMFRTLARPKAMTQTQSRRFSSVKNPKTSDSVSI